MKKLVLLPVIILFLAACQEAEQTSMFTGNEATYALQQASGYAVSGTVTFKERKDGATVIEVNLTGTSSGGKHPVHLHLGDISTPDADIAAQLNPVSGDTGKSETILTQLADETLVSYSELIKLKASMKVHLSDTGMERNVVLAAGNIGVSVVQATPIKPTSPNVRVVIEPGAPTCLRI